MDPVSLASAAVALLGPYFVRAGGKLAERTGETIAEAALPKVKALYERLRAKLAPDSYPGALLGGVREEPEDAGRQEILKVELTKILSQDQAFKAEVQALVEQAEAAGGVQVTASGDAGIVAGGNVTQSAGGNLVTGHNIGGDQVGGNKTNNAPRPPTDR